eukprot:3291762-Pleurochrysis_carterae.AAC.1
MLEENFSEYKLTKYDDEVVQALLFYSEEITPLEPANTVGPSNAVQQSAAAGPSNAGQQPTTAGASNTAQQSAAA